MSEMMKVNGKKSLKKRKIYLEEEIREIQKKAGNIEGLKDKLTREKRKNEEGKQEEELKEKIMKYFFLGKSKEEDLGA